MLRSLVTIVCVAALLTIASGAARAEQWKRYANDRFGQSADYPAGWTMGEEPANNDGRVFISPDGAARITISGSLALESRAQELADAMKSLDGQTVTYRKRSDNRVVLSGTQGDRIFYWKRMLVCRNQIWNSVYIEYPAAEKMKYDFLVAHVAASLKPGSGYQIAECR